MLWTLGGRPSLFPDRFQLGGPTNMRVFRANGMGPRDGRACAPFSLCVFTLTDDAGAYSGLAWGRVVLGNGSELDHGHPAQTTVARQGSCICERRQTRRSRSMYAPSRPAYLMGYCSCSLWLCF